ncbi:MAG: bifunctional metallophosphatase/5'-nucleotidase [Chlamydiia bacterium]
MRTRLATFLWALESMVMPSLLFSGQLTLFTFNDVYRMSPHNGFGGLSGMATLLKCERLHCPHHITCVNGDFLSPSLMSTLTHGVHMVQIFNEIGVDLVVLGNHEFDFGTRNIVDLLGCSRFQWLGANCLDAQGYPLTGRSQFRIEEVGGVKVGFFGVVTPDTAWLSKADEGVRFKPVVQTAKEMIQELKRLGCEVFIALTHLSINEDRLLVQQCPDLHCVLGGHEHFPLTWYEGNTFIHKSGYDAQFLCRIDLEITRTSKGVPQVVPSWRMIANRGQVADRSISALVASYEQELDAQLNTPVAILPGDLDSLLVRSAESSFGDLVADALCHAMHADCAVVNAGAIRGGREHHAGPMLKAALVAEMPFTNHVGVLALTGEQLLKTLEHGLHFFGEGRGSFLQVSGLQVLFDPTATVGHRVLRVLINDTLLDLQATYQVACLDYLIAGGDGYTFLGGAPLACRPDDGPLAIEAIVDYLTQGKWLSVPLGQRLLLQASS